MIEHYKADEFKTIVEQKMNDALHRNGGKWSDCSELTDKHWQRLIEIMDDEINDIAVEHIEEENTIDEPHPSLSAAERNPNLR